MDPIGLTPPTGFPIFLFGTFFLYLTSTPTPTMTQTKPRRATQPRKPVKKAVKLEEDSREEMILRGKEDLHKYFKLLKCPSDILPEWHQLWSQHPTTFDSIHTPRGETPLPRYQQNFGHDYTYGGKKNQSCPDIPDNLLPLVKWIRETLHVPVNGILVNWYDGNDHYIGAHSDKTTELVPNSSIVSISLGQPIGPLSVGENVGKRRFLIREKATKVKVTEYLLSHGDCLIMKGGCQERYTHEVPKVREGDPFLMWGQRINITARCFQ